MYWIEYAFPFLRFLRLLRFCYGTFPAFDSGSAGAAEVASPARAGENGVHDSASNGGASSGTVSHKYHRLMWTRVPVPQDLFYMTYELSYQYQVL